MKAMQSKVVIVTGAAAGIGKASALLFAREGALIVAADADDEGAARTAKEIVAAGGDAIGQCVDIRDEDQVARMVTTATDKFGRLDCALNNAGIGHRPDLVTNLTVAEWRDVLDVNVIGTALCLKYQLPAMIETGGGSIVCTSSLAGVAGAITLSIYAASKHAVNGLVKTAAAEFASAHIRINAICPGNVATEKLRSIVRDFSKLIPTAMRRPAEPNEIAEAAMWLLSDRSSYVTGQELCVDGGMRATTSLMPETAMTDDVMA